jgi:lipopolysaccharide assembly outer membrane protein LptD (OstA)
MTNDDRCTAARLPGRTHAAAWYVVPLCACLAAGVCCAPAFADAKIGKFNVTFAEGVFHRNGDFVIPGALKGVSTDGDFVADRAFGNYQRQDVTLVGHVIMHQKVVSRSGPPGAPITLEGDQVRVVGKPSTYTATGSVVVIQGNRNLHSDYLQLNDATGDGILRGNVKAQENDRVVNTAEAHYNTRTGAVSIPGELTGFSKNTDFRADRADGNRKAGTFVLSGNVVVHKFGNYGQANNSSEPITLWCDRVDIQNRPDVTYTATGHVRMAQGDRTLVAPVLKLNDTTHIATMTGGVHGEERPDRTFDAAELLYNTQTEDFKALGGVKATFPFRRASAALSPSSKPTAAATPLLHHSPLPSPTSSASPTPLAPTPGPSAPTPRPS